MILLTIFLTYFTGILILWLFDQYKHLNIFEHLWFWFGIGLSLFILEIFLEGIIFSRISLLFPIITFFIVFGLFLYRCIADKEYLPGIIHWKKETLRDITESFKKWKLYEKVVFITIALYVIGKVFLSFSINTAMPTYDEDAVNGWDMKTKVFFEDRSLILDPANPEFLWSALDRNIFAPMTDTYFLLGYSAFPDGLSNIISPLIYLSILLSFFWIFLRKLWLWYALIGTYIFASLPFVFIHSFGSYFNYISGYFLFIFAFYLGDQLLRLGKGEWVNHKIVIPLAIFAFLDASIRNESILLMSAIIAIECILFYVFRKKDITRKLLISLWVILIWPIIAYLSNIYINSLSSTKIATVTANISWGIFEKLSNNLNTPWVLSAPFVQSFHHPDYNILYLLYALSLIVFIMNFQKMRAYYGIFFGSLTLLAIFMLILFINVEYLWLLTHYSFIRYPIAIIPFIVYVVVISLSYFIAQVRPHHANRL